MSKIVNIGYNNVVMAERIIAVVNPDTAPVKRIKVQARRENKLVDATNGRKTRAVLITDSGYVILSSLQLETLSERIKKV